MTRAVPVVDFICTNVEKGINFAKKKEVKETVYNTANSIRKSVYGLMAIVSYVNMVDHISEDIKGYRDYRCRNNSNYYDDYIIDTVSNALAFHMMKNVFDLIDET